LKLPTDPILLELMPEFIETWVDDINQKFDLYYEDQNSEEMFRFAHSIKGSCLQFSLNEIGQVGIEMLQKVKDRDWDSIYPYKQKLLEMFYVIKVMLNKKDK